MWFEPSQGHVYELEEANTALEGRVEEAEGNLAASQAETETTATDAQQRLQFQQAELKEQHSTLEAEFTARVSCLSLCLISNLC